MSKKDGVSIREIQNFLSTHLLEIILTLHFTLLMIFTPLFPWGHSYTSILLACLGGLCGFWLATPISKWLRSSISFCKKQETGTLYLLAGIALAITCFTPPLAFFGLGTRSGLFIYEVFSNTSLINPTQAPKSEDLHEDLDD